MLKKPKVSGKKGDTDSAVIAALKCASQIMQQRIISQPKDMMGIILFGTKKSKFQDAGQRSGAFSHLYLLTDLNVPAAEDVQALKTLAEEGEDVDNILETSNGAVSMPELLHCAIHLFTTNAPNFGSRRLFIITDNDSPHSADKDEKSVAAVRAKDLFDIGARIELFPISRDDEKFDSAKFYDVGSSLPHFDRARLFERISDKHSRISCTNQKLIQGCLMVC
jgi:ATP-dependent DNA helicase 2 subunit 1